MSELIRRRFLQIGVVAGASMLSPVSFTGTSSARSSLSGMLDPATVKKYVTPLVIPPAMPPTATAPEYDYYEIAVRQFRQQILPAGLPATTVWSYASVHHAQTLNYPAFTIEARHRRPVRIKWVNGLVDRNGRHLPHILPIDQTLHWANPPGGKRHRDSHGTDHASYRGPVPIVTHVHGNRAADHSDGYPEAWYLPDAADIPEGYARR